MKNMASSSSLLSLSLGFLLLFHGCLGRQSFQVSPNECQLRQINAFEPSLRIQAEAGVTEFWDPLNEQFQCAGAHVFRHIINPRGLLLPSYTNSPLLAYAQQGTGYFGIVVPGCPETYQSFEESEHGGDRHQKIGVFRKGDVIAFPEGAAHWLFNSGEEDVILVVLQDTTNDANQLDANPLRFFLAGNGQQQQQQHGGSKWQEGREEEHGGSSGQQYSEEQQQKLFERLGFNGNLISGLRTSVVSDSFNTDRETSQNLKGENDERGHIITVQNDLELIHPLSSSIRSSEEQERQSRGGSNGLEETICSPRVRENIDSPARTDIYDPQAGSFSAVNRFTLPILANIGLSAARGRLNRNYGMVPGWAMNAQSIFYVTRGRARAQIVNNRGETILDEEVREGQLFLVPQHFVLALEARDDDFEWVEFNTNEAASTNSLPSTLMGLPAGVISASYRIPVEKAVELKRGIVSKYFYKVSSSSPSSSRGSHESSRGSRGSGRAYAFLLNTLAN